MWSSKRTCYPPTIKNLFVETMKGPPWKMAAFERPEIVCFIIMGAFAKGSVLVASKAMNTSEVADAVSLALINTLVPSELNATDLIRLRPEN